MIVRDEAGREVDLSNHRVADGERVLMQALDGSIVLDLTPEGAEALARALTQAARHARFSLPQAQVTR